jgi:hypothetical protein
MGGGLLQNVNRDSLKFAYKCKCSNITLARHEDEQNIFPGR